MDKVKDGISSERLSEAVVEGMKETKASDITVLDLREVDNAVTDFFVICTGTSSTQIEGIAQSIIRLTRKTLKERPWHKEGQGHSNWVLIDYVSVVVHVFSRELREYYDLEELWADAKKQEVVTKY